MRHGPDWKDDLQRTKKGDLYCNAHNALLFIENTPEYRGRFLYDEMKQAIYYDWEGRSLRPITDDDVSAIQRFLQAEGMTTVGRETVFWAVDHVARQRTVNPLLDFMDALEWDGVPRLDDWLSYYLGAEATEYTRAIGRMFLVSLVARARRPGCQVDYMLVLEGEQGEQKSTACRILAGDEYFSDNLPDLHRPGISQHLRGKWLIEVSELSAMSKADTELLKAFITRREERYRPPYGRAEVFEPRHCCFVGTTNKECYLHDETGARRFWPVKCGAIDIKALTQDRDQLLAEAVHAYRLGEHWWPDRDFEREHIQPEQEKRFDVDAWEDPIARWLKGQIYVTLGDVAVGALDMEMKQFNKAEQNRIKQVLTKLEWTRAKGKDPATNRARWKAPGILDV